MELKPFREYIEERYVNAIGDRDVDKKEKYKQQVWDILQTSYAPIGGIKGDGFKSPDDMVQNIPFWKMVVKDGVVHVVVMYKDKGGRKSVAVGTNGSHYAKKELQNIFRKDIERAYGEKSKSALGAMLKTIPWEVLQHFMKTPKEVQKILKDDEIIPLKKYKGKLPPDAEQTLARYPHLKDYAYFRKISGDELIFKVMIGTPGKTIV
jgi:hypothetical protein